MSYDRKEFDKKKLKKLATECGYFGGSYYDNDKERYIRFYKSSGVNSVWAIEKKIARKKVRRYLKTHDTYNKNISHL